LHNSFPIFQQDEGLENMTNINWNDTLIRKFIEAVRMAEHLTFISYEFTMVSRKVHALKQEIDGLAQHKEALTQEVGALREEKDRLTSPVRRRCKTSYSLNYQQETYNPFASNLIS